jgi:hypothetical protein
VVLVVLAEQSLRVVQLVGTVAETLVLDFWFLLVVVRVLQERPLPVLILAVLDTQVL